MTTIYWHHTGPLVRYNGEFLFIADLNPEMMTQWRMSRLEMVRFAIRALWASAVAGQEAG